MNKPRRTPCCELCNEGPTVYCVSDSAFLCSTCDARVHQANFLAARHLRVPVRSDASFSSSPSSPSYSSSTESCVSRAEPARGVGTLGQRLGCRGRMGLEARARVMARDWCRTVLGSRGGAKEQGESTGRCVVEVAMRAVEVGIRKMRGVPVRCLVAAAVWMAVQMRHDGCSRGGARTRSDGGRGLTRVEECSGVPSKVILLIGVKLSRLLRKCHVEEEGWAECP